MEARTMDTTKNWEALGMAIVEKAIKDYERGKKLLKKEIKGSKGYIRGLRYVESATNFFNSQWFMMLANCDGPTLQRRLDMNLEKYGKCMPFIKKEKEDSEESPE